MQLKIKQPHTFWCENCFCCVFWIFSQSQWHLQLSHSDISHHRKPPTVQTCVYAGGLLPIPVIAITQHTHILHRRTRFVLFTYVYTHTHTIDTFTNLAHFRFCALQTRQITVWIYEQITWNSSTYLKTKPTKMLKSDLFLVLNFRVVSYITLAICFKKTTNDKYRLQYGRFQEKNALKCVVHFTIETNS